VITRWTATIEDEQARENAATIEKQKEALLKKAREYQKELDMLMV
jgi:hypothetical protein